MLCFLLATVVPVYLYVGCVAYNGECAILAHQCALMLVYAIYYKHSSGILYQRGTNRTSCAYARIYEYICFWFVESLCVIYSNMYTLYTCRRGWFRNSLSSGCLKYIKYLLETRAPAVYVCVLYTQTFACVCVNGGKRRATQPGARAHRARISQSCCCCWCLKPAQHHRTFSTQSALC